MRSACCITKATNTHSEYVILIPLQRGPGSSIGIVTDYVLDGPGIESWWGGEIFRACLDRPWGPLSFRYNGYRVFPGGKVRPGRDASAEVMEE
jgi:hypothetical protein